MLVRSTIMSSLLCFVCLSSYDRTLSDACASLADKWSGCDVDDLSQFKSSDLEHFSAYQKKAFLALLLQHVSYFQFYIWLYTTFLVNKLMKQIINCGKPCFMLTVATFVINE